MDKYTIKNFKSCRGEDGEAFSLTLCRDGKKVADVTNSGMGGETYFRWHDWKAERVNIEITNYLGEKQRINCTPEEALLYAEIDGKTYEFTHDNQTVTMFMSPDVYVCEMISKYEENKQLRKACKTKTLIRLKSCPDEMVAYKIKFCQEVKDVLIRKCGEDLLEFVNERTFG